MTRPGALRRWDKMVTESMLEAKGDELREQVPYLAGYDAAEYSTGSITAVDMVTIGGLSIPAAAPFLVILNARKITGAAVRFALGLKINAVVTGECSPASVYGGLGCSRSNDENGHMAAGPFLVPGYSATISAQGSQFQYDWIGAGGAPGTTWARPVWNAARPNAVVTSISIRGRIGGAAADAITGYVGPVFVLAYPLEVWA